MRCVGAVAAAGLIVGCQAATSRDANHDVAARLLELERRTTAGQQASGYASGDDPYRVRLLSRDRTLVLLRGRSALVLLGEDGRELNRVPTPESPVGWAFAGPRRVFVAGEFSATIQAYDIAGDELVEASALALEGVAGIRDLEWLPGQNLLLAADGEGPRILSVRVQGDGLGGSRAGTELKQIDLEAPAVEMRTMGSWLLVNELLAHRLRIVPLGSTPDFDAATEIRLDGPIWSWDAIETVAGLRIAIGAVEDHPLDRSGGEFGYIDSFLYVYEVPAGRGVAPHRVASLNLSAEGVVTPKALRFSDSALVVSAFGSERLLRLSADPDDLRVLGSTAVPAGASDLDVGPGGRLVLANPLFDAVFALSDLNATDVVALGDFDAGHRSFESRLGELIFFTTLMAPANVSDEHHSRFTCETCHFEGEVDGRTHYTGRGSVFATTKTLRGLAGNVPVFSRGGDASLSSMVMAEFEVANQLDPWFSLDAVTHPSLVQLGTSRTEIGPDEQREALLTFLVEFGHRRNPFRGEGARLSEVERAGLGAFRDHCSSCHQPLTSTRETGRFIPFQDWDFWVTDPDADLVWGAPLFFKTGIEPYVSDRGARAPSLRRVGRKVPHFTNGTSATLEDVLRRFRVTGPSGLHAGDDNGDGLPSRSLTESEIEALLALLRRF